MGVALQNRAAPLGNIGDIFMKKILCSLLTFIIVFAFFIPAFAAGVTVSAQETALSMEQTSLIAVNISGNVGIMGFKIIVKYNVEKVDIVSVSKGTVTNKGNFISNFGANDGEFNIVWNNTNEVKEDGSLFVIGVKAKQNFDSAKIALSFSQPDTFNEQYKDVVLSCKDIVVSCKKGEEPSTHPVSEEATQQLGENTTVPAAPQTSQIKDAVDIALKDSGYKKISDVEKTDTKFVEKVNGNLEKINGNADTYRNLSEVKRAYNNATESEFLEAVNNSTATPEQIKEAVEKAMADCSVVSVDELDEKTIPKFLKKVEQNLKELDKEIPTLSESIDENAELKAIKKLYGSLEMVDSEVDLQNEAEAKRHNQSATVLFVCIAALTALSATIALVVLKKRKK